MLEVKLVLDIPESVEVQLCGRLEYLTSGVLLLHSFLSPHLITGIKILTILVLITKEYSLIDRYIFKF